MEASQLSLHHRFRRAPRPAADGRTPLLILLHGYGSNEDDLMSLAPYLDPRFDVISVRAPHVLGAGSYAWFPIVWDETGIFVEPADVVVAIQQAVAFVEQAIAAYGAYPQRTLLLGFSQGATMSAGVLLRRPDLIAGAALMSGFVPAELAASDVALDGKPVLITHGLFDDIVPVQMGRATRDLFASLGASVTYREYPIGHQIDDACLEETDFWMADWLKSLG
ncbi:MAG: alpha/beta hydrolase [Candidatus Brachytrichaceae bacterium NZ_4S206]|jgi:phospholipase/carboxylesterase